MAKLYDGKTLAEWRLIPADQRPTTINARLEKSDAFHAYDPRKLAPRYEAARDAAQQRTQANAALRQDEKTERSAESLQKQTMQAKLIEARGRAFILRYCDRDTDGREIVSERMLTELQLKAIGVALYHLDLGSLDAAKLVFEKLPVVPAQPLEIRVRQMDKAEIDAEKEKLLAPFTPAQRAALEAQLAALGGEED